MKLRKLLPLVVLVTSLPLAGCSSTTPVSITAPALTPTVDAHQVTVDAFNTASTACTTANQKLAAAITSAQTTAKTGPSTMQDPPLLDKLNAAVATAQAVKPCTVPSMATDDGTIQRQTTQLGTDTQTVTLATSTLSAATSAVAASVNAKQQADAAAAAAKEHAAKTGSTTLTDSNGYTYTLSWQSSDMALTQDPSLGVPGTTRVTWSATVTWKVVNTTSGKIAPGRSGEYFVPMFTGDPSSKFGSVIHFCQYQLGAGNIYYGPTKGTDNFGWGNLPPNGTASGTVALRTDYFDVPNDELTSAMSYLSAPAGWVYSAVLGWSSSSASGYSNCAHNPVFGVSDSLK